MLVSLVFFLLLFIIKLGFNVMQMDQERLRKIASAVRTGGKGTMRR